MSYNKEYTKNCNYSNISSEGPPKFQSPTPIYSAFLYQSRIIFFTNLTVISLPIPR